MLFLARLGLRRHLCIPLVTPVQTGIHGLVMRENVNDTMSRSPLGTTLHRSWTPVCTGVTSASSAIERVGLDVEADRVWVQRRKVSPSQGAMRVSAKLLWHYKWIFGFDEDGPGQRPRLSHCAPLGLGLKRY
jgi:hypothetical protein